MTKLDEALDITPWRPLAIIGRQRGLRFSSNIAKADLADRLAQTLIEADNLSVTLMLY